MTVCVCVCVRMWLCVYFSSVATVSQTAIMGDSTTMAAVPADIRARFNHVVITEWLPGSMIGECLYRGSRDGMTASGFHRACDGKGATLTLISRVTFKLPRLRVSLR